MSLQQEFIPSLEIPLGEQATPGWDTTALQAQFGVTITTVAWSVENAAVLTLGTPANTGDIYFAPVIGVAVGCSHLIADVTTSDVNQNPTKLLIQIFVIDPKCSAL